MHKTGHEMSHSDRTNYKANGSIVFIALIWNIENCSAISKMTLYFWASSEMMTGCYEASVLWFANSRGYRDTINCQTPGPSDLIQGILADGIDSYTMHESIPTGKPRAFDERWVSGTGHLACSSWCPRPPGHLQTTKNWIRNILSSFPSFLRCSEVNCLKHRHFGVRKAFVDHKRPIKTIKHLLSLFPVGVTHFVTCFMQFFWAEIVLFVKKWKLILFVCWSMDWEGGIWPS